MTLTQVKQSEDRPSFEALDEAVDGIVANARLAYALTTVDRACEHGEWARAFETVAQLTRTIAPLGVTSEAWRELLSAAALFAVRADEVSALRPIFEDYADRAWSDDDTRSMPWDLSAALDEADRLGRAEAGLVIARLIGEAFPTCPLGPMARGHFSERLHLIGDGDEARATQIAAHFEEAADLAEALEMPQTTRRCRLRAGTLLLATGTARDRGRQLLREVPSDRLERADALWYAVGMSHSPFWLDRVRAADAILGVFEDDATEVPALDTRSAARYLIDSAPLELEALEIDRLGALIDEILERVPGAEDVRAPLELREQLGGLASAPADQADVAADILARSTVSSRAPDREAAVEFCRAVAGAFESDEVDVSAESLERIAEHFPLAASALDILSLCSNGDADRLATRLGELEGQLRRRDRHTTANELKSLGLLWGELLEFVDQIRFGSTEVDSTTLRRIAASTAEILGRWIPDAPAPGYGWWALAANLLAAGFDREAALATRRAIDDGEHVDDALENRVLAAVVDHAIEDGEPDEMRHWLTVAEKRLA